MVPFDAIPDDLVPLTAYFKQLLALATREQPLLVFLDSVDQIGRLIANVSFKISIIAGGVIHCLVKLRWSSGFK